jgi:hypothetical protein
MLSFAVIIAMLARQGHRFQSRQEGYHDRQLP